MRRFSFKIDLNKADGLSAQPAPKPKSKAPTSADGFEMSGALSDQRQSLKEWPFFQSQLELLPDLVDTLEEWSDPNLAAEYIRIYQVSKQTILDAAPGFSQEKKMENHCFFAADGTKHVVSRLLTLAHQRVNESRLAQDGSLIRLYYENTNKGPQQNLDTLFEHGLLGLEDDVARFACFPDYVMRFFILSPEGEFLKSSFRGVCFYDEQSGEIVTEEARSLIG